MMKKVSKISFYTGSREELLPGFTPKFPYISSCSDITKYPGHFCPWHWHPAVELFYLKHGPIEYNSRTENSSPGMLRRYDQLQCSAYDKAGS